MKRVGLRRDDIKLIIVAELLYITMHAILVKIPLLNITACDSLGFAANINDYEF